MRKSDQINRDGKRKILFWVFTVYILSLICYLPMLAERLGIILPRGFGYLKYLFVCVPLVISLAMSICEGNIRGYFTKMFFGKIRVWDILTWLLFAALGMLLSYGYSFCSGNDIIKETYPSFVTLLMGCLYLSVTGLVEEAAWRGFLLERLSAGRKSIADILLVGFAWAVWHIPMWAIRNSLGVVQIVFLCVWTVLVSLILGIVYSRCGNILAAAMLHMVFNICFLAPIQYNIFLLGVVIVMVVLFKKGAVKKQ